MKNILFIFITTFIFSCSNDENVSSFLPNHPVNIQINMDLPIYNDLLYSGGLVEVNENIGGIRGLIIYRIGNRFLAFDRACPHISLQTCAVMHVESIYMVCECDDKRFQLINGAAEDADTPPARAYIVTQSGNTLNIRS